MTAGLGQTATALLQTRHGRLTQYLVERLLDGRVVVVGRDTEDAAAALRQCLRIAAARELPLELVAPDRFVTIHAAATKGLSRFLADQAILTPEAEAALTDPLSGPVFAPKGEERWVYEGVGRFTRRSGRSEALASRTAVEPGVDGPQIVRLEGDGC